MKTINMVLFGFLTTIILGLLSGVVIADLWVWFLTPVFPTLEPITNIQGFGIALVINYFKVNMAATWHHSLTQEHDLKYIATLAWLDLWFILITWGITAIIHTLFF